MNQKIKLPDNSKKFDTGRDNIKKEIRKALPKPSKPPKP